MRLAGRRVPGVAIAAQLAGLSRLRPSQQISSHPPRSGLCDRLTVISSRISSRVVLDPVISNDQTSLQEDSHKYVSTSITNVLKLKMGVWRDVTEGSLCRSGFAIIKISLRQN